MDIIAGHISLDFDGLAAMIAASRLFPDSRLLFPGSRNHNVRRFYNLYMSDALEVKLHELKRQEIGRLIIVDTRDPGRIGDLRRLLTGQPAPQVILFDHHPPGREEIRADESFISKDGALTTAMLGMLREKGMTIDPVEASLYALGIHEDTGSLTNSGSTASDAEAILYLMEKGAMPDIINEFLSTPFSESQSRLMSDLLETARVIDVGGNGVMLATAERDEFIDDLSVIAHRMFEMTSEKALFVCVRMLERVYIIGRSLGGELDVAAVLEELGGGGHPAAASATLHSGDVGAVTERLSLALKARAARPITAADLMTEAVVSISSTAGLAEAEGLMQQHGFSGLPVVDEGRLTGIISQRDIDKARRSGLIHAPVKGFAPVRPLTISPGTEFSAMERLMVEEGVGRLPVLDEAGRMLGIVTRRDLTKAMLKRHPVPHRPKRESAGMDMLPIMNDLLDAEVLTVLDEASLAARPDERVFLVGGMVRDLLLGLANVDIDLVVEGDGIGFAERLVARLPGQVKRHGAFGTAAIRLDNGVVLDVASARIERYARPAAPPDVFAGSLSQDLFRRDFTINAMAVSLNESDRGALIDESGGRKDLKAGLVRVLHDFSFLEDPTRVLRGVRFETRLGFRFSSGTERQARNAIALGLLPKMRGTRYRDELIQGLGGSNAVGYLARLHELGVLPYIFGPIGELPPILDRIEEAISLVSARPDGRELRQHLPRLAILLDDRAPDEVLEWCREMRFRASDAHRLAESVAIRRPLENRLKSESELSPSALYSLFWRLSRETLAYLWAASPSLELRRAVERYVTHRFDAKIEISGRDLLQTGWQPGPELGAALEAIRAARLDGKIKTKQDELAMADSLRDAPPEGPGTEETQDTIQDSN